MSRPRDKNTGALLHPDALHDEETPVESPLAGEVPMVDRDGTPHLVHADDVNVALHRGWSRTDLPGLEAAGHEKQLRDENGDAPVQTFLERGASGLTFGVSDAVAAALGADTEAMEARARYNPNAALAGNVVGGIAGAFVPGLGEAGLLGKAGELGEAGARAALGEGSALARIGVKAGGEAARGAVYGLGQGISESALTNDPNLTGEQIAANLAKGALWGAAGGAVVGGALSGLGEGAKAALGALPEGSSLREVGAKWATSRLPRGSEARSILEDQSVPGGKSYIETLATTKYGQEAIKLADDPLDLGKKFVDVTKNIYDDVHSGVQRLTAEKVTLEDAVKNAQEDLKSSEARAAEHEEATHIEPKINKLGLRAKFEQVGETHQGEPRFAAMVLDRDGKELGRVTAARELRAGEDGVERPVYPISLAHMNSGFENMGIGQDLYTRFNRFLSELPEEQRGGLVSDTVRTRDSEKAWKALAQKGRAKPSYVHELDPSTGLASELGPSRYWTMVEPRTGQEIRTEAMTAAELADRELQTTTEKLDEASAALKHFHEKYSDKVLGKQALIGDFEPASLKFVKLFSDRGSGPQLQEALKDVEDLKWLSLKLNDGDPGDAVMGNLKDYGEAMQGAKLLSVDKLVPRGQAALGGRDLASLGMGAELLGGHIAGALGVGSGVKLAQHIYSKATDPLWWLRAWRPASAAAEGTQGKVSSFASKLFTVARKGASKAVTPTVVMLSKPRDGETTLDAYQRRSSRAVAFAANPEAQKQVAQALAGGLDGVAPQTGQALAKTVIAGNAYIASKVPRDPLEGTPAGLMRAVPWRPSNIEIARFNKIYVAVKDPTSILSDAVKGPVSKDAVEAVQQVYPSLYADMQRQLMQNMAEVQKALPYEKRLALGQVFGVSVDPSLEPAFLAAQASPAASADQRQGRQPLQAGSPGSPKGTFSTLEAAPSVSTSPRRP